MYQLENAPNFTLCFCISRLDCKLHALHYMLLNPSTGNALTHWAPGQCRICILVGRMGGVGTGRLTRLPVKEIVPKGNINPTDQRQRMLELAGSMPMLLLLHRMCQVFSSNYWRANQCILWCKSLSLIITGECQVKDWQITLPYTLSEEWPLP